MLSGVGGLYRTYLSYYHLRTKEFDDMYGLYPTEERRATLRAFQIYEGSGNLYEMAVRPPRRTFFEF